MNYWMKDALKNKNIENGIWLYALQFFNSVIPLLTLPYVTRILGKDMYGLFSISINIIGYLQVVTEYGFGMSATRKVIYVKHDKNDLNSLFTSVLISRFVLLIPCFLFSVVYMIVYRESILFCKSYAYLAIGLVGYCLQMNWLFQGMQEMKYISIISIISRLASLAVVFAFVKGVNDLPLYSVATSVTPILNGIIGVIISKKVFHVQLLRVSMNRIKEELKDGWYVFTTQLSSKVFNAIGITFLGIFSTPAIVGEFSAIQKIPQIIILIWAPISQVLYPISSIHMKNSYEEGISFVALYRKRFLIIFSFIASFVALLGKWIISLLFGIAYTEHFYWVYPLLLWLLFAINNNFLGIQILLGSGHDKEYSKCFQVGVICTLFFNYVLVRFFGGHGASIAPLIAESILGILLWNEVRKLNHSYNINEMTKKDQR